MKFSEILKELLQETNLNQTAFAKLIGVKPSQVSEWLREKANPGYETLKSMAIALDVSTEYLLGIESGVDEHFVNVSMGDSMTADERELLQLYRGLSPYLQSMTMEAVKSWSKKGSDGTQKKA